MSGRGPISERLGDAYSSGLYQLQPERLPWPDLREPLRDILDYFGTDERGGTILDQIEDTDRARIAGEIFDLYEDARDRLEESDE